MSQPIPEALPYVTTQKQPFPEPHAFSFHKDPLAVYTKPFALQFAFSVSLRLDNYHHSDVKAEMLVPLWEKSVQTTETDRNIRRGEEKNTGGRRYNEKGR
ncbi:uncharacterized [Tachysurus ichikawai]